MKTRKNNRESAMGQRTHYLYGVWHNMVQRCTNSDATNYKYYGGKGVSVCEEWRYSFLAFRDWAIKNGAAKGLKLDKDKIGDGLLYSPSTCCFLTHVDNMRHTSRNNMVEFNGESMCLTDWAKKLGIKYCTLFNRINTLQWPIEKALTTHKKERYDTNKFKKIKIYNHAKDSSQATAIRLGYKNWSDSSGS